jgi:hypothetical protein
MECNRFTKLGQDSISFVRMSTISTFKLQQHASRPLCCLTSLKVDKHRAAHRYKTVSMIWYVIELFSVSFNGVKDY